MSTAVLVELLLMTFVLVAPTLMVAVLVVGTSRRAARQPVGATLDTSFDGAEVIPLRTVA